MIEILITPDMSEKGTRMLRALASTCPQPSRVVSQPSGTAEVLMLYGPGNPARKVMADAQLACGKKLVIWDLGYFAQQYVIGGMRFSVDQGHPAHLLDLAPADGARWDRLQVSLRDDYDPKGPIILVGLGPKTRAVVQDKNWENLKFTQLRRRFPGKRIIFRPKPRRAHPPIPCEVDAHSPIEKVLNGASLVVVRHSNVACDAVLAGIPYEASDGAVKWLDGKPYSRENRLEFLQRLMYFNWLPDEAAKAWGMVLKCVSM